MAKKGRKGGAGKMKKCPWCPQRFRELARLSKHQWGKHHASMLAKTRATRAKKAGGPAEPKKRAAGGSMPLNRFGIPRLTLEAGESIRGGTYHPAGCRCDGCR